MDIELPEIVLDNPKPLELAIYERVSIRKFWDKEIDLVKLSKLFWVAQGKKDYISTRTVPSAGATYPLKIYAIIKNKGFYLYNHKKHILEQKIEGDICSELLHAAWNQSFICEPYLTIIICADYKRTSGRYGKRAPRYVYMEVGHCAQNIHLEAVALDLGSVPIGAFKDEIIKEILQLPEEINPLYIIPIGYPK